MPNPSGSERAGGSATVPRDADGRSRVPDVERDERSELRLDSLLRDERSELRDARSLVREDESLLLLASMMALKWALPPLPAWAAVLVLGVPAAIGWALLLRLFRLPLYEELSTLFVRWRQRRA